MLLLLGLNKMIYDTSDSAFSFENGPAMSMTTSSIGVFMFQTCILLLNIPCGPSLAAQSKQRRFAHQISFEASKVSSGSCSAFSLFQDGHQRTTYATHSAHMPL